MGAGPDPVLVRRWLSKAEKRAEEYSIKYGVPCTACILRASNGEACGAYNIHRPDGTVSTVLNLNTEDAQCGT